MSAPASPQTPAVVRVAYAIVKIYVYAANADLIDTEYDPGTSKLRFVSSGWPIGLRRQQIMETLALA